MRTIFSVLLLALATTTLADPKIEFPGGPGQAYLVYSEDPFEGTRDYKYMVAPNNLYIRCDSVELKGEDAGFDQYSFPAEIKFKIGEATYDFKGTYNTVGISDSRYYRVSKSSSPKKYSQLISALKAGESALVGGKWHADWEHSKIDLAGFSAAYKKLNCE